MGWLYVCCQDAMPLSHDLSVSESIDSLPTVSDTGSYFEAQAQVAASIGMSASVISQIRTGTYTYDQIETLLAQRRHVIDTIRRSMNPSTASVPPTPKSPARNSDALMDIIATAGATAATVTQKLNLAALPMSPAGTPSNTPADSQASTPQATPSNPLDESPARDATPKEGCTYQVCHSCRPFFQDRLSMSFEPALNIDVHALANRDVSALPVHSAAVVSKIGLRRRLPPTPLRRSEESMDITMHQRDGNGCESFGQETSSDCTPTTTTSSEEVEFDLSPRPAPGVRPAWLAGSYAYDSGYEDNQRDFSESNIKKGMEPPEGLGIVGQVEQNIDMPGSVTSTPDLTPSKGSSISLPNPPTTPLTGGTLSSPHSSSLPERSSPSSNKSSNSSRGSEVEVEGGVALTEEAVELGTPDIAVGWQKA